MRAAGFPPLFSSQCTLIPHSVTSVHRDYPAPSNTGEVDAAKELRAIRFLLEAAAVPVPLKMVCPGAEGVRKLRAAGYVAEGLVAAGFTLEELVDGGIDAWQLKAAGYTPEVLVGKGFGVAQWQKVGAARLRQAGFDVASLLTVGFDVASLKTAGFTPRQFKGVVDASQLKQVFGAAAFKGMGFTVNELRKGGFSGDEAKAAGYTWRCNSGGDSYSSCFDKWDGNEPRNCRGLYGADKVHTFTGET